MNQHFDTPEEQYIYYVNGHRHDKTQYVDIKPEDLAYIRYMYSMLWGHILEYRDTSTFAEEMYIQFFVKPDPDLPRPARLKAKYNTWATFLQGIEHNFVYNNTKNLTEKQLPHVIKAVNLAVEYFTVAYRDFDPNMQAYPVRIKKAYA